MPQLLSPPSPTSAPELSDQAWEAAAQARRRAGAKPRVRRQRRSIVASTLGAEEGLEEVEDGDDSPTSSPTSARRKSSLAGFVSIRRYTDKMFHRPSAVTVKRRAVSESLRPDPLPKMAEGFENLGAFVKFHRDAADDVSRQASKDRRDDDEPGVRPGSSISREASKVSERPSSGEGIGGRMARISTRLDSFMRRNKSKQEPEDDSLRRKAEMDRLIKQLEEEEKAREREETMHEFKEACRCDDVAFVRRFLGGMGVKSEVLQNFDVDATTGEGVTPALAAARCGRAQLCAALLDGRADPLARDRNPEYFRDSVWPHERNPTSGRTIVPPIPGALPGMTVVYHMCLTESFEDVMDLVFPQTRLSVVRAIHRAYFKFYKKPPAVMAAMFGNLKLLCLFLTHSAVTSPTLGMSTEDGPTSPTRGVNYWAVNRGAGTPILNERAAVLLMACTHRNWRCAEVVLAAGVSDVSLDNTLDPPERTALHLAAACGEAQVARLLLKAGASPTVYSGYGRQPLHDACASGHLGVAKALVDRGGDPMAKVRDGKPGLPWKAEEVGMTALELAGQRGFGELKAYLQDCHRTRGILSRALH